MPHKIEYGEEDFLFLKKQLESIGFHQKDTFSFRQDMVRLGLVAPRKVTGREEGFWYSENGLTVKVWISYVALDKAFREKDTAWILMSKGDPAVYFSKPVRRTKSFLLTLIRKAWVAQYRVRYRPICSICKGYMDVHQDKHGGYYWICFHLHTVFSAQKPEFRRWDDIGPKGRLPEKAKAFVEKMRARVAAYKKQNEKKEIVRTPMRKIRKRWKVMNPGNKI